jgi:acylphosphatase
MPEKTFEIKVKGFVQGVGFRRFVFENAKRLGLRGYAKNLSDGSVEVLVTGDEEKIKQLYEACKIGPFLARVEEARIKETNKKIKNDGFLIL